MLGVATQSRLSVTTTIEMSETAKEYVGNSSLIPLPYQKKHELYRPDHENFPGTY